MPPEERAVRASAWLRSRLAAGTVSLVRTGVGTGLPAHVRNRGWTAVVHAGTCGALTPGLRKGDRLLPAQVVSHTAGRPLDIPDGVWGTLLTSGEPVRSRAARLGLARRHQAEVVDMESYGIAEWCQSAGIRYVNARVVADGPDDPAGPEDMLRINRSATPLLTDFVEIVVKNIVENRPPGTGTAVVSDCTKNGALSEPKENK